MSLPRKVSAWHWGPRSKLSRRTEGGKQITYKLGGTVHTLIVDEILVAAGRLPNLEALNLEAGGIQYNKRGVEVDDTLRTTNPDVYAAGDVATRFLFTHTADATARNRASERAVPRHQEEGERPGRALGDLHRPGSRAPSACTTGRRRKPGSRLTPSSTRSAETDRGRSADGDEEGFVKVHVKQGTDKILGATIVGRHAGELISEVTVAMTGGLGLRHLATVIHPYPTEAEAIRKAADAYNRTRLTPLVAKLFKWWFSWRR